MQRLDTDAAVQSLDTDAGTGRVELEAATQLSISPILSAP
jgi:hypothetical protein